MKVGDLVRIKWCSESGMVVRKNDFRLGVDEGAYVYSVYVISLTSVMDCFGSELDILCYHL